MCCLLTVLVFVGPRAGIVVWWLIDPARWAQAFNTFILPALGFLFLPWTTLAYVFVGWNGLAGLDLLWIVAGVLVDAGALFGGGYGNRERLPV